MKDPHPDTVAKIEWMVMGVLLAQLVACVVLWAVMKLCGYEQINLTIVIRP